ncbi:MAG: membrane protein insertase YidC [Armatimonadetes bacterium]|nr:membrane protein insertase YidC [Armatimonadota bacterium]
MDLIKRFRGIGVLLGLVLTTLLSGSAGSAAELSEPVRRDLIHVAELREAGKAPEAIAALEEAAKKARQDRVATPVIQFVTADVYLRDLKGPENEKKAFGLIGRLRMAQIEGEVEIPGLGTVDIQEAALKLQDERNQDSLLYRFMAAITGVIAQNPVTGRLLAGHSGVLAILLLTIAIKVVLTPFTVRSFRSMRDMQKLQPLMKELQQRYKDKPQELQRRTMELYKEHGVNPVAGCLPMLLQMPIIILLWRAIDYYQYPLSQESFLWIKSLAMADMPLALIYAASLFLSSKLTMMPTADPQQASQQRMMAYMMPVMFFWLFKGYPAGFILGWLAFNVLTTAQQWHIMRGDDSRSGEGGTPALPQSGPEPQGGGGNGGGGARRPAGPAGSQPRTKGKSSSRSIKRKKGMVAYHRGR